MRKIFSQTTKQLCLLLFFCGNIKSEAQTILTVTDCNLQGWIKFTAPGNSLAFKSGIGTPPLGQGSLEFKSPSGSFVRFRNNNYHNTALANLTAFSYDTYIQSRGNTRDVNYVVLQIDRTGDGISDDNLVFSPWYQVQPFIGSGFPDQGHTVTGAWQTWDMLHGAWWAGPVPDPDNGGELFTLANYISRNPEAKIVNAAGAQGGGIRLTAGAAPGIFSQNFIGNTDKFIIGVNGITTIYDFEFTTANAGPDKTVIYGYGSNCTELNGTASGGIPPYTYSWTPGGSAPNAASTEVCPTTTTTYTLTVTDLNGCVGTDQVTVFVNDVRCGNNMDKVMICHNDEEICIAAAAVQAHLDHGDILGACPVSAFLAAGKKPVNIIPEQLKSFNYPNPATEATTIQVELPVEGRVSIRVYNAAGMEMTNVVNENKQAGIHRFAVNMEKFTSGMYYYTITVQTRNGMHTERKKLVKL